MEVTCCAPVNIAVVKYWGKRDTARNLPTNASLSVTLSSNEMCSTTTIRASKDADGDRFWLNGVLQDIAANPRLRVCLQLLREKAAEREKNYNTEPLSSYGLRICSQNNFPTAAGLASSASGFACLVYTLAQLYGLLGEEGEEGSTSRGAALAWLSTVARQGSGSACRSLFGGFVAWNAGEAEDGSDSAAEQVASELHWPELEILVCVVSAEKKGVSSTSGMQTTVATSALLQHRVRHVVPERMAAMREAIGTRDFARFAEMTMRDSNQFHAVCLDTYPPIFYLNDVSRAIIAMVHRYNDWAGETRVAYTFDAGPNAVLYTLHAHVAEVKSLLQHYFLQGEEPSGSGLAADLRDAIGMAPQRGGVRQLLHTRPGGGPAVLPASHSLLDASGLPKSLSH